MMFVYSVVMEIFSWTNFRTVLFAGRATVEALRAVILRTPQCVA